MAHLTKYDKEFIEYVKERYSDLDTPELIEKLLEIGVVDTVKLKILTVRTFVDKAVKNGTGKVDAMYMAAEKLCLTYEYVRKCMYYNTDVNLV